MIRRDRDFSSFIVLRRTPKDFFNSLSQKQTPLPRDSDPIERYRAVQWLPQPISVIKLYTINYTFYLQPSAHFGTLRQINTRCFKR
jgi:hypothetical protein